MVRLRCTYCHDSVERSEGVHCAACLALHHAECHTEHGRCAVLGCGERRALVAAASDGTARPEPRSVAPAKRGGSGPRRGLRLVAIATAGSALLAALGLALAIAFGRGSEPPPSPPRGCGHLWSEGPKALTRHARDAVLLARDFRLPVVLQPGDRLRVTTRETGYTHVVLQRGQARAPETLLVAEPGDRVALLLGDEHLHRSFGEDIVLEGGDERAP